MKADVAVRTFVETYDEEAIKSIDNLINKPETKIDYINVNGFNIKEAFDSFIDYIDGYKEYVLVDQYEYGRKTKDEIIESMHGYLDKAVFKEEPLYVEDSKKFISEYVNGCNRVVDKVNDIQSELMLNDVDHESIGNITEYADIFMDKMDNKFNSVMTSLLRKSGYIKVRYLPEDMFVQEKSVNII